MSNGEKYENVVIGTGPAGRLLTSTLASASRYLKDWGCYLRTFPRDESHIEGVVKVMSSTSIAIASIRTVAEPVTIEDIGREIVRWGLIVVLTWIGAMKFTAYEAMGIQPLVAHSPLVSWMYDFLSIRSFSALLGCIEITTAALLGLRYVSPIASAAGSLLAIGLFATTLSFLITTPGWEPTLGGFPALSAMPGQFLLKDIVLFGGSVWSLGESLKAIVALTPSVTRTSE